MKFNNDKFHYIRKAKGYSIEELANKLKISRVTLWAWEKGKRIPSEKKIISLAKSMNINVSEFSDLSSHVEVSQSNLSDLLGSIDSFIDQDIKKRINLKDDIINKISILDHELTNSLMLIKALINSMDSMFYIKDSNLNFVMANKAFIKKFGVYNETEFIRGRTDKDFFDIKFAKKNVEEDQKVLQTGVPVIKNEDFLPYSRKNRWILISKLPVMDNSNRIAGIIGIFIDITERKKDEELRKIIEANIDVMSDGLTIYNIEKQQFMYINKTVELIYGYSAEEIYKGGIEFLRNTCLEYQDKDRKDILNYTDVNSKLKLEHRIIKPNNEVRWVEVRKSVLEYMNSTSVISVIRDITERKKLEQDNQFFLNVMDNFNDVVWISELDNEDMPTFRYLNSEIEKLTGFSKDDFYERKIIFRDIVLPEYREELDFWLTNKVSPGIFEAKIRCADNSIKWVNSKISKILDDRGKIVYYGLLRDITYKKRIEDNIDSLDLLLNNALDMISAYEVKTMNYLYVNKIVEKITGYPVQKFYKEGALFWLNTCVHPDDREQRNEFHKTRTWPEKSRYRIIRADGKIRMIEVNVSNKIFPFNNKECIVSVARDVTDTINV